MTDHDCADSWFLAQIKPNSAQIALRNLGRQGFRTFLPVEEVTQTRNGRFMTILRPVFPGYVFVAFDVTLGLWRKIQSTNGITRLVSFGTAPAAIPADIIQQLMQRCDADGRWRAPAQMNAGDQVRLKTGPFTDFIATIETVAPDRRVWLLMDVMGAQTRVAVDADQLRSL